MNLFPTTETIIIIYNLSILVKMWSSISQEIALGNKQV